MKKTDKLYLLAFILSFASLAAAVILKLCGVEWFDSEIGTDHYSAIDYVFHAVMLTIQAYIMLGCMTWIPAKELIKKYVFFIPINALPLFLPAKYALIVSTVVFAIMTFVSRPKLSTIPRFMLALVVITIVQQASMWLKYSLFRIDTMQTDLVTYLIGNIDQLIILSLYYYIVVKWGDKIAVELVLFWKNRQRKI
jgi:hypothetical protein